MQPADSPVHVRFSGRRWVRRVFLFCLLAEIVFFILDYHINYGRFTEIGAIRRMFNTAREDGLASWFAVTQTTLTAVTVWMIYVIAKSSDRRRWVTIGWFVLALFFSYMAMDDGATIHERLGSTIKAMELQASRRAGEPTFGTQLLALFPSYSWQIFVFPFFVIMGLFLFFFLCFQLKSWFDIFLVLTALGSFIFAVALDFVEGLDEDHKWNIFTIITDNYKLDPWTRARFRHSAYSTLRHFQKSFEECVEMFGNTLLWVVFLRHLFSVGRNVHVKVVDTTDR